ncbi:hypothetical protein [Altericista sp. CCNU0014]|uniref:hypothetical protein n=1 Tax=Altericista sp. CCNU0014 TaxID=3082949 RepID=UPI00384F6638
MTSPNVSPPGPKRPRSPWVWVGLGCGTALLLTFGGCVLLFGTIGQRAAQEMGKPLDRQEAIAKLGDTPIYQPSTFNETMTKGARLGSSIFPGAMVSAAAFNTSDGPDKVIGWYEQQLAAKGYRRMPEQFNPNGKSKQATFQNKSEGIIVQMDDVAGAAGSQKNYTLLLMRMRFSKAPS